MPITMSKVGVVVGAHAEVPAAEAAGAGAAEGVDAGVEERHPARQQQQDLDDGHHQIDAVEDLGGVAHAAHQLARRGAGHLRPQHMHPVAVAPHGQNGHHEHQHAHAAHPVGEAPPEQAAAGQGLHLREDGGAGGGKAGDGLKNAVHEPGDIPGDIEGQSSEDGHEDPRQSHHCQAVSGIQRRMLGLPEAQQSPDDRQQRHGERETGPGTRRIRARRPGGAAAAPPPPAGCGRWQSRSFDNSQRPTCLLTPPGYPGGHPAAYPWSPRSRRRGGGGNRRRRE